MSDLQCAPPSLEGPDGYRLTTSFPYLVRRVGLRVGELFDRAVEPFGVDVSMYRVMAALAEADGQQLGQLSAVATIEMSTLSRLVGTMVGKGLLTRRRPRGNGRIVEISLSARGRKLALELMPIAMRFEAAAVAGLSAQDVRRIKAQLEAAYENLDQLERQLDRDLSAMKPAQNRRRRRTSRSDASASGT